LYTYLDIFIGAFIELIFLLSESLHCVFSLVPTVQSYGTVQYIGTYPTALPR